MNLMIGQSGGPTAAINASLYGAVTAALECGKFEHVYGMVNGIEGFMAGEVFDFGKMTKEELELMKVTPSSFLGSCRYRLPGFDNAAVYDNIFSKLKVSDVGCMLYIGGNDSMDTVSKLSRVAKAHGSDIRFIGIPKTIDNDIWGTDVTFGFQSAIDVATHAIDCIYTTAESHNRVFVIETMGHKVGWITLYAGVAGGADVILLPEIPYDMKKVYKAIDKRKKMGKNFVIIVAAEGAISKEVAKLPKKERKAKLAEKTYPSIAYEIANDIQQKYPASEVRVAVPGHTQRGGNPDAYDRVLSSRFGAKAAELFKAKDFGKLVVFKNNEVTAIPMEESAGKLKYVDPDNQLIQEAKTLGISFGD